MNKKWIIVTTREFEHSFKQLDRSVQMLIIKWIKSHLLDVDDPTSYGKPLLGNKKGYWRYRVGDYRIIVEINEKKFTLVMINIGHRSIIYED